MAEGTGRDDGGDAERGPAEAEGADTSTSRTSAHWEWDDMTASGTQRPVHAEPSRKGAKPLGPTRRRV
jgi:hypothetical protein